MLGLGIADHYGKIAGVHLTYRPVKLAESSEVCQLLPNSIDWHGMPMHLDELHNTLPLHPVCSSIYM